MNRQKGIAVFAVIAAVAMTTIGLTGVSAESLMISSIPQSQEVVGMLGHVEYTKMNSDGQIIAYLQSDNTVVDDGKDCTSRLLFGTVQGSSNCISGTNTFQFVAIGNGTDGIGVTFSDLTALNSTGASLCAQTGGVGQVGEMARKQVIPVIASIADAGTTIGSVVILDTSLSPFEFKANNVTIVLQSAIFNADVTSSTLGQCTTPGAAGTDWNMFAIQELNTSTGITVTDGDSLSVKWTITIG